MHILRTSHCLALGLAVLSAFSLSSQTSRLSDELNRLFGIADSNNSSIRTFAIATQKADADVKTARSEWLPDIGASLTLSYIGNGQLWNRSFGEYTKAEMPHFGNSFSLNLRQPIYTGGAITGGIRVAELSAGMARLNEEGTHQGVRLKVALLFMQWHCLENGAEVLRRNIALADTLISLANNRRNEGVALKNDVTRYELMRSQMTVKLTSVANGMSVVKKELATALNVPDSNRLDLRRLANEDFEIDDLHNEDYWQQCASSGNTSIKQSATLQQISRQQEKIARSASLPKVSFIAENNLNGPILIEVPPIDKNFNYWFAGINISYDISSLYKNRKKVRSAAIATRQIEQQAETTRESVYDRVHEAYMNLLTARSDLQTHRVSCRLAKENYDVIANRYSEGLALVTDMTDAANVRLDAELQLVNSQIAVANAFYQLKFIVGNI